MQTDNRPDDTQANHLHVRTWFGTERRHTFRSPFYELYPRPDLRGEADRDLARRSIAGVFSYFAIWLIIYLAIEIDQVNRSLFESLGLLLAAAAIGRLYLALYFKQLYLAHAARWRLLFSFGTLMSAGIWGGVAALALNYEGIDIPSIMVLLSTAGIAAGGIVSLAPAPRLAAYFVAVLLLPTILVTVFSGQSTEFAVAMLFLTFWLVITAMWYRIHHEYWNALFLRRELVQARDAAEAATRAKGQFIASVSHELRTPLTSVIGALGMIMEYPPDHMPDDAKVLVDMAYRNGKRLSVLINDILDFEKLEARQMAFHYQHVDLASFLQHTIELNEIYSDRHHVTFTVEPPPPGLAVRADENRLMQVMTNLLSNAAKNSPAGETVRITAAVNAGAARISVIDHGPGVPEDFKPHIFERFAQAQNGDSNKAEGTGLGLAISRSIVEQMGGTIGFDSVTGKGATFHFDLPLADAPLPAATQPPPD